MALVKQIYDKVLYLFDKKQAKNSGIFVENLDNCYVTNKYNYENISNQGKFNNERVER